MKLALLRQRLRRAVCSFQNKPSLLASRGSLRAGVTRYHVTVACDNRVCSDFPPLSAIWRIGATIRYENLSYYSIFKAS